MVISIIVAIADNDVIGRDGTLPWRISSDLKTFRRLTMGKPLIMGRRTFQSLKKPLDGRCDVVVSGVTPAARFWTLTLFDRKGHLVANSLQRYGFTSQEIVRGSDGQFEIRVAARSRSDARSRGLPRPATSRASARPRSGIARSASRNRSRRSGSS